MAKTSSSFDRVRRIGLAMPGVEESSMYGAPALKLKGVQMFACMASHKSAEPGTLVVRLDLEQRDAMLAEAPDTYYLTDHYVGYPCVLVRLSRIQAGPLRDLLAAGYRFVANARKKHR